MLPVLMLLVILLVGGTALHFSRRYLHGSPMQRDFQRWFVATLAAAATVVASPNIIVMAAAWTATSLCLHRLLSLDGTRVAAQLAAHKKFLLSRVADVSIWSAVGLLVFGFGSASRSEIITQASALTTLPVSTHAAFVLLAFGVILRSAQLPFHGWLVQVMDVPTPVSALLHAGIVNLGAFVLVTLAPLLSRVPTAQAMLVVSGTITAILAVLVMRTRANVKGALAWSTVAQMGFVLVECGLGAYQLAMLHIVAHACYKSHAFLSSGQLRRAAATVVATPPTPLSILTRGAIGLAVAVAGIALFTPTLDVTPAAWFPVVLIAASVTAAFVSAPRVTRPFHAFTLAAFGLGLPALYTFWEMTFAGMMPTGMMPTGTLLTEASVAMTIVAWASVAVFVLLTVATTAVAAYPTSRAAEWLYAHASCGFNLDELFTTLTFRFWPPSRLPERVLHRGVGMAAASQRVA
ncbi:MAG TPA: proton-conducting transporter membrane subunit [Gemmatimonas sp.]|nr:proton-conducting transporter membrane subunit [Gemmatimonas sp.]